MAVENELSSKHVRNYEADNNVNQETSQSIAVEVEVEKFQIGSLENIKKQEEIVDVPEAQEEFQNIEDADAVDTTVPTKQANTYAAKKTVAQGMMDIALITANANQLRYIIEFNKNSSTYYLNIFLITVSLLLQVAVGVSLIFKGKYDLRGESKHERAKRINNYVVVGIFLVTIINVFIASFTITGTGN